MTLKHKPRIPDSKTTSDEGPHTALENTFNRKITDQLFRAITRRHAAHAQFIAGEITSNFRSVAHGVSAITRRHAQFIAGASPGGPQRPQRFTYKVAASITEKTYGSLASMATFLYDHLLRSGDLALNHLPTPWLESVQFPSEFGPKSIRSSLSNGYLLAGDVIA